MVYLPAHFEETRPEAIEAMIAAHPLATLITLGAEGLTADHIPLIYEPQRGALGTLIGHVARNNALWREHPAETQVLAVFQGPAAYISPTWYPTKAQTHEVVPTWNYAVVHLRGPLQLHHDEKWLLGAVGKLTTRMEGEQPVPWKMADAPRPYMEDMLSRIVGIEIPITSLVAKWKMGQNRVDADRVGASDALAHDERDEAQAVGAIMRSLIER